MKKLWAGRFDKKTNPLVELFTESVSFDYRLAYCDIAGSIAHAKMLARAKIISAVTAKKIISGLKKIKTMLEQNKLKLTVANEDIHMNIEVALQKLIGPTAHHLHTGRSRNDQVQLDTRLYTLQSIIEIYNQLAALQKAILFLAEKNKDVIIPGYTHLQQAQPILLAHHLLAYINMLQRDKERLVDLQKRIDIMPLGSGALAGSSLPLDRNYVAKLLGFSRVSKNSIDSVSDRDYLVELLAALAITGTHISRLADDLILWNSSEFNFIDIDQAFCTGSSLMPQKKNPDVAELLRAKTGRLNGNLISLLTILKGLPLAYNRDLQEDKPPVFDSIETIICAAEIAALLMRNININKKWLTDILGGNDYFLATDLTEYLVRKRVPFRQAHEDVGRLVRYCIQKKKSFRELTLTEFKKINKSFGSDILRKLSAHSSVTAKKTAGSTNPGMVAGEISSWKKKLK